ncbi:hypothetical protein PENTCL1PPCAC_9845, partial [Pristionchus entomophagus]
MKKMRKTHSPLIQLSSAIRYRQCLKHTLTDDLLDIVDGKCGEVDLCQVKTLASNSTEESTTRRDYAFDIMFDTRRLESNARTECDSKRILEKALLLNIIVFANFDVIDSDQIRSRHGFLQCLRYGTAIQTIDAVEKSDDVGQQLQWKRVDG